MALSLPDTANLGDSGHITDHNLITAALTSLDAAKAPLDGPVFTTKVDIRGADPRCTVVETDKSNVVHQMTSSDGNMVLSADANNVLAGTGMYFFVDNVYRAQINDSGNMGLGAVANTSRLFVKCGANNVPALNLFTGTSGDVGQPAALIEKSDNNTTTSQIFVRFTVNNTANASGQINANGASQAAFGSWSDARLKENVESLPEQLPSMLALRPVEFDYIDGSGHQIGFIAQEVQEVYPDLVSADENGMLMLSGLGKQEARLIKALQEAVERIEALEARIAALEAAAK